MTKDGILAALLFLAPSAWADDLADRIVARLASYPVVRAEFAQQRTVASLTRPVTSSGRLVFSREGLIWQVEAPVKAVMVFSANGANEGGAAQAEMGRLIRALIAGDLRELRTTFDVQPQGDLERWTLRLRPKTYEVSQYLRGIELAGGAHLETIGIVEASGDSLTMRMRNFVVAPELAAAERRQLLTP
jgi:hypothetical protein